MLGDARLLALWERASHLSEADKENMTALLGHIGALRQQRDYWQERAEMSEAEARTWPQAVSNVLDELARDQDAETRRGFLAIAAKIVLRQMELAKRLTAPAPRAEGAEGG